MADIAIQSAVALPEALSGSLPLRRENERSSMEGLRKFTPPVRESDPAAREADPVAASTLPVFENEDEPRETPRPEGLDPVRKDIQFRLIEYPQGVQALVVDQETDEILRETPPTSRLRFARAFRESIVATLGHRLDVSA